VAIIQEEAAAAAYADGNLFKCAVCMEATANVIAELVEVIDPANRKWNVAVAL
jgi:hypothetical protein